MINESQKCSIWENCKRKMNHIKLHNEAWEVPSETPVKRKINKNKNENKIIKQQKEI